MENELLKAAGNLLTYSYGEMAVNMTLALVLGILISFMYRYTHTGLSYSQSFTHTIVFVSVIVAVVMMVIGASLARAFALVGALSIIRFRTVVKDTKDTSFVFAALAVGMASGTSNYFLAVLATLFICSLGLALYKFNFGALYKSEFILRFVFEQSYNSEGYLAQIEKFSKRSNMLNIEPSGDGRNLQLTYDITLKDNVTAQQLIMALEQTEGTSDIVLIASKNDVNY